MKYLKRNELYTAEDDPLTSKVIGVAIEVHKEIGPGFPESIYHRALEIALADAGVFFQSEVQLPMKFRGRPVGDFFADFIIEHALLVELKALEELPQISEIQVIQYLKASGLAIGLILNFGASPLQIKRKYRDAAPNNSDLRLYEA